MRKLPLLPGRSQTRAAGQNIAKTRPSILRRLRGVVLAVPREGARAGRWTGRYRLVLVVVVFPIRDQSYVQDVS